MKKSVPRLLTHHPYTDHAPYAIPVRPGPESRVPGGAPSPRARRRGSFLIPASTLSLLSAGGGAALARAAGRGPITSPSSYFALKTWSVARACECPARGHFGVPV